ncbi:MAG: 6,7-dimethyl-8-ribityllumazine synthase [Acidimicrobiales bacterium]
MKTHTGALAGTGLRIAIVASRFNDAIVTDLVAGARSRLQRLGVDDDETELVWVPGAFEIPAAAKAMAATGRFDAVVCLGAVIRGATPHFDQVAAQAAAGCARVGLDTGVPTIFGVLTTDTIEQALERAGTKAGNKGEDAAEAAVEMVNVLRSVAG